jgi:hypothetical protein
VGQGAGFADAGGGGLRPGRVEQLPHDFQNYYYVAAKGAAEGDAGDE